MKLSLLSLAPFCTSLVGALAVEAPTPVEKRASVTTVRCCYKIHSLSYNHCLQEIFTGKMSQCSSFQSYWLLPGDLRRDSFNGCVRERQCKLSFSRKRFCLRTCVSNRKYDHSATRMDMPVSTIVLVVMATIRVRGVLVVERVVRREQKRTAMLRSRCCTLAEILCRLWHMSENGRSIITRS